MTSNDGRKPRHPDEDKIHVGEQYPREVRYLIEELTNISGKDSSPDRQAMARQLLNNWNKLKGTHRTIPNIDVSCEPLPGEMTKEEKEEYFRNKGKSKTQYIAVLKRAIPVDGVAADTITAALYGDCTLDQLQRWVEEKTKDSTVQISLEICRAEVISE